MDLDFDIRTDGELLTGSSPDGRTSYLDHLVNDSLLDILESLIRVPSAGSDLAVIPLVSIERSTGATLGSGAVKLHFE